MTDALAMLIAVVAVIGDVGIGIANGILLVLALSCIAGLAWLAFWAYWYIADWLQDRAEARLNRREAQLRRTILTLADAIAEERIQARNASAEMVRARYLARGEVPGR